MDFAVVLSDMTSWMFDTFCCDSLEYIVTVNIRCHSQHFTLKRFSVACSFNYLYIPTLVATGALRLKNGAHKHKSYTLHGLIILHVDLFWSAVTISII